MKITSSQATRWATFGVATVCAIMVGAIVAILVLHPFPPDDATPGSIAAEISVIAQPFDDSREVQITIEKGPDRGLLSQAGGLVTSLNCIVGSSIANGSSPVSIDGVPRLGLATTMPMWRDLPRGARGSDVTSLQAALTQLGYDVASDRQAVGPATLAAFADALKNIGSGASNRNTIWLRLLVWIPDAGAKIAGCTATVGQQVAPGSALAVFAPGLAGAHITKIPDFLIPGTRVLELSGKEIAVDQSGTITDRESLAALADSAEYAKAAADSGNSGIPANYRLVEKVAVAVVPPSAVIGPPENQCVVSGASTIRVTVVGSQLGQTFVMFEGDAPSAVAIKPSASTKCK